MGGHPEGRGRRPYHAAVAPRPGARRRLLVLGGACWALVLLLVLDRLRLVAVFGSRYTDGDQTVLWGATRDVLAGIAREPYFYGQRYGSWFEAVVAAPLVALDVPLRVAVPLGAAALGTLPWLLLAATAWWGRRQPVAAVVILASAVALSLEGTITSTLPRGFLPGLVLGCLAVAGVLWSPAPPTWPVLVAFGAATVVSASLNPGAGLLTGPVAAHLGATLAATRSWRRLGALGAGALLGIVVHQLAQGFYDRRPSHDLHHSPPIRLSAEDLVANAAHPGRYLDAFAPELLRTWVVPALLLAGAVVWLAWQRRPGPAAAAIAISVLVPAVLATPRAEIGRASVFLPWNRLYLGVPWLLAVALLLALTRPDRRQVSPRWAAASLVIVLAATGAFAVRQVTLVERVDDLVETARGVAPVVPVDAVDLEQRCGRRQQVATAHRVSLVIDRYDQTAAYACAALAPDGVATLFPTYERRAWRIRAEAGTVHERVLVSGVAVEACAAPAHTCTATDLEDLTLVEGGGRSGIEWAKALGIPVRRVKVVG